MNNNELKAMKGTVEELRKRADMLERIIVAAVKEKEEAELKAQGKPKPISEELGKKTQEAIAHYCSEWKLKYKSAGVMTRQQVGQVKSMAQDIPLTRLKQLITSYLKMNDTWFIKKRHDLTTMKQNLQAISHFADTGAVITNSRLNQMDKQGHLMDMAERVNNGEL